MDLSSISIDDLENELLRREELQELVETAPRVLDTRDFTGLIAMLEDIKQEVIDGIYHEDNDNDAYISEVVFEAVYGKNWWDWFNKNAYR